jgi:hypothetical protein
MKKITLFLLLTFLISCEKHIDSLNSKSNAKSLRLSAKDQENLVLKISNSKPFQDLYNLAVKDKISNKLKKGFKLTDDIKMRLSSMKSRMEYEQILTEMYDKPSMKIKQLENIYYNLIELQKEFPELRSSEPSERNKILQSAFLLFIEKNNEKARVMIPNPDDCARNCQAQLNLTLNSAYNQFLYTSAG